MGRRGWRAGLVVALAVAAVAGPAEGSGQAEGGPRRISGTIRGVDNHFVNAQISLVLRSANGTFLQINGQPSPNPGAYADTISMNPHAPLEGLAAGGDETWSFTIPSNAATMTLEVYPRASGSGAGNWSHYGGVARRRVPIPGAGLANVRLRFPLNCDVPGGTTGSIRVQRFHNGQPAGNLNGFLALAEAYPPGGIQGFRHQRNIPAGQTAPEFDGIAPGRRYSVNIYSPGFKYSFYEVPVRACQRTDLIAFTGSPPFYPPRFSPLPTSMGGTSFPVAGDFDGDGDDDIYLYGPGSAADEMWTSTGTGNGFDRAPLPVNGNFRPVAGDFNRDGIDDIFFYGPGSAPDRLWRFAADGSHQSLPASAQGTSGTWPVAGDFDGNGYADILFSTPGGTSTLRRHTPTGSTSRNLTVPSGFAVRSGDIDGDARDDLMWHRGSDGSIQLWFGRATGAFTVRNHVIRSGGFRPILADVSGDFRADAIFYAPGSGADLLWRGRSQRFPYFAEEGGNLGIGGSYSPITGDWNGDGTADILWYAYGGASDVIWRSNLTAWNPQIRTAD